MTLNTLIHPPLPNHGQHSLKLMRTNALHMLFTYLDAKLHFKECLFHLASSGPLQSDWLVLILQSASKNSAVDCGRPGFEFSSVVDRGKENQTKFMLFKAAFQ